MAEELRETIDRKSAFWKRVGQFQPNFRIERDVPTNHFCTDRYANECLTTLSLTVSTQRNSVADFLPKKCNIRRKTTVLCLEPASGGQHMMVILGSLESALWTSH